VVYTQLEKESAAVSLHIITLIGNILILAVYSFWHTDNPIYVPIMCLTVTVLMDILKTDKASIVHWENGTLKIDVYLNIDEGKTADHFLII